MVLKQEGLKHKHPTFTLYQLSGSSTEGKQDHQKSKLNDNFSLMFIFLCNRKYTFFPWQELSFKCFPWANMKVR